MNNDKKNNVVSGNNIVAHLDEKVENENQPKLVFGQSVGEKSMNAKSLLKAIRERRLFKTTLYYIAYYIARDMLSGRVQIADAMTAAPEDVRPKIKGSDYVRTASLELMAHEINGRNIKGSVAELGVFQGDFAALINRAFPSRTLYLFDTFEGFAEADVKTEISGGFSTGKEDFSDTSEEMVLGRMPHREKCIVRRGWFPQTAEGLADERFVFVSIDADLYDPIYEGLKFFYPRLVSGGVIFVHDFNNIDYKGCAKAVRVYCEENGVPYFLLCDACGSAVLVR